MAAVAPKVDNHAGHVWVEALLDGRWVHIDPCEAAVDDAKPRFVDLIYMEVPNLPNHQSDIYIYIKIL